MTPCRHCGAAATPDQRFCRHCGGALNEPVFQPTGGGVTGGVATADMTGRSCPYCRFTLKEGLPIQECGFCHTVHHTECWEENGGCCVTGCAGGPTQATQVHAATPGRPPAPPPPPPPFVLPEAPIGAPGPGKQIPVALAAVLAGVVAILGAGAALALSSGGSSNPSPSVTVPPVVTTETTATETTPTETTTTPNTTTATTPTETTTTNTATTQTTPQPNEAPLAAVNEHWHDIQTGDYQGAWEDEAPSLRGNESSWVHAQEEAGVESVSYQFEQSSSSGNEATVNVVKLRTVGKQNGCQNWTGGYGVVNEGGTWRISSDSLESHRCY
jgi:hypothetical protein